MSKILIFTDNAHLTKRELVPLLEGKNYEVQIFLFLSSDRKKYMEIAPYLPSYKAVIINFNKPFPTFGAAVDRVDGHIGSLRQHFKGTILLDCRHDATEEYLVRSRDAVIPQDEHRFLAILEHLDS
jgi:hypothetical protein